MPYPSFLGFLGRFLNHLVGETLDEWDTCLFKHRRNLKVANLTVSGEV